MNRRAFLRGAGAAIALPYLPSLGCVRGARVGAQASAVQTPPKRLVIFFTPDGTNPPDWTPKGSETSFTLGPILQPLAPHQQDLLILSGVDMNSALADQASVDGGHQKPMGHVLTGHEIYTGAGGASGGSVSIDQAIASQIGGATKFGSLQFGVQVDSYNTLLQTISYSGANQAVPAESNPTNAFNRIFADVNGDPNALLLKTAQRKSVLDLVGARYQSLASRLGSADQQKLGAHLAAIRDLEMRLDTMGGGASCAKPSIDTTVDWTHQINFEPDSTLFPKTGTAQMDLLAMALACDLTRVASLQWSISASPTVFSWLGMSEQEHPLSHTSPASMTKINTWYAQQLAYLIGKLKSFTEADGSTVFDNTVIVWTSQLGEGWDHTYTNIPYVLCGSAGKYFRTGRYVTYQNASHNDLLVSLQNAMGIASTTFGNPAYCKGPLPNLT